LAKAYFVFYVLFVLSAVSASAQTMKASGPNWTKTKVFLKLERKFVIPEEMAEIATYNGMEIKLLFDKLLSPAFYDVRGNKMIDALKEHGYGMVPVPPGLVATAPEVWLTMRMEAIQSSFNKDFSTQSALATGRYKRMPTMEEVVWFARVIWVTRNQLLFEHVYVRTSSPSLDGGHLCVGENEGGVLKVKACADDLKSSDIGVTAVAVR
jgi:hypothetical protein